MNSKLVISYNMTIQTTAKDEHYFFRLFRALSWEQAQQNSSLKVTASGGHKPLKIGGLGGKLQHNQVPNSNLDNDTLCDDP